ncbi:response regulator [Azospirillum thermophilum]|uniref:Response regulatory domain-containing protein n=1 Tax=Azospirillum thermophilum TaxID=2202148 RepID=A0A2S2CZH1_9PROT|nr:response regulator [Azospirillum thermophilum]AWK89906.1 hypothetical protein DEW08_28225 [Azospirillum thermophilum]
MNLDPGYGRLHLMVVEDVTHTRQVLRGILRHLGFPRVSEASCAAEAFDLVRAAPPDIILTDWEMPGGSGLDLVRMVRTRADSPDPMIPVIMLTAHGGLEHVIACRDAGATDYLVKPFSPSRIATRIVDVVSRQRPFVCAPGYRGPDRRRARRPVPADRRSPIAPAPGVRLLPPDGLLAAKVAGDPAAVDRAVLLRQELLLSVQPDPTAEAPGLALLDEMAAMALGASDRLADALRRMAGPLDLLRCRPGGLSTSATRVVASLQRIVADPASAIASQDAVRLHLMALRAILRAADDPAAERTAEELASQIELLGRAGR